MTTGLGLGVGVAWIAIWSGLTYALSERLSRNGRSRPSGPTMVAASGIGAALVMILVEMSGPAGTAATGMYIVIVATCGAMGWVALAAMPVSLPARPWTPRISPSAGRALGPLAGPLAFALLLVVGAGVSPADKIDWTTTHLAIGAILAGSLGWVTLMWTRPQHQWARSWPVGPRQPVTRSPRAQAPAATALRNEFQQRWATDRLAPRATDRAAAEAAADALYVERGLAPPLVRIWLRSPRETTIAGPLVDELCARLAGGRSLDAAWRGAVANRVGIDPDVVSAIEAQLASQAVGPAGSEAGRPRPSFAPVDLVPAAPEPDTAWVGRWASSERAAPLDPIVAYQLEQDGEGRAQPPDQAMATRHVARAAELGCLVAMAALWPTPTIAALGRLAGTSDAWGSFDGLSVFQDPPTEIRLDASGLIHADDRPAVRYADDWAAWALHGVPMPRVAVEDPDSLRLQDVRSATTSQRAGLLERFGAERYRAEAGRTAELIASEPNVAMRRELIEAYGPDRYLQSIGDVIHTDVDGLGQPRRLWRAERRGDDPLVMVEVRNSTPEPDGSRRTYWLRVPPQMRDCQSAVAWTFGIAPPEFVVEAEA